MNLIERSVKDADTLYQTGAKMTRCSIEDQIMDYPLELYEAENLIAAISKRLWQRYGDEIDDVLQLIDEANAAVREAGDMAAHRESQRDLRDEYLP